MIHMTIDVRDREHVKRERIARDQKRPRRFKIPNHLVGNPPAGMFVNRPDAIVIAAERPMRIVGREMIRHCLYHSSGRHHLEDNLRGEQSFFLCNLLDPPFDGGHPLVFLLCQHDCTHLSCFRNVFIAGRMSDLSRNCRPKNGTAASLLTNTSSPDSFPSSRSKSSRKFFSKADCLPSLSSPGRTSQ